MEIILREDFVRRGEAGVFCRSFFMKKISKSWEIHEFRKREIRRSVIHKTHVFLSLSISSKKIILLLHGTEAQDNKNPAVAITKRLPCVQPFSLRSGFTHMSLCSAEQESCSSVSLRVKGVSMHEIYLHKIRCNQMCAEFDFVQETQEKMSYPLLRPAVQMAK